ncbi:Mannose/glucose-specific lectin [Bienertia sinuspersici]
MMVRHGYIVDGIGFEITDDSGESNTVWYSRPTGDISEVSLNSGEYITQISGTYGKYFGQQVLIASIKIHTNTNPNGYGPYGRAQATEDVKPFATPFPSDSTLVGFFGNYGNPYLTSIGAYAKYGRYGGV